MRKFMLASTLVAVSGVMIAPAALAQNTDIDRQENIRKEYQKAMDAEQNARERGASQPNPDDREERRDIDDPDNISQEYRKAMEDEQEAARRKMDGVQEERKDHLEQRKHIDSPEHISEESRKAIQEKRD